MPIKLRAERTRMGIGKEAVPVMAESAMQERGGWFLPSADSYFTRFIEGKPPKRNGFQKEHLLEAFKHVKQWRVAVDVGAHIGMWTWDMAQRFQAVFAFEPLDRNFECLLKNVEECGNVKAFNLAVGDQPGLATIQNDNQRPGNTGSYYILPNGGGTVHVVSLDEMAIPCCDLLKIDVEGFEVKVLEGASWLIREQRPVIIMECTDSKFRGRYRGIKEGDAERWLKAHRYREVAHMRPDKVFIHR